jgi:hypothetical protein
MFSFFLFLFLSFFFVMCRGLVLDLEYRQCGACSLCLLVLFCFCLSCLVVPFLLVSNTMSLSSGDNGSIFDCVVQGPGLAKKFCAGWEGWLEGACLAQLSSDRVDAAHVAVLHAGQNDFLVVAEEGDFPHMGPWHHDGWVDDYSRYYHFGCLVYMDPFDERYFDSMGFFSAHMEQGSCIVYDDQVGGHCCWMNANDWWIFC